MTDETPAASPYGPAAGATPSPPAVPRLDPTTAAAPVDPTATAPAAPAAPVSPGSPDLIARARARMRTTARVLGFVSIGLLVAFLILVAVEQATGPVADITEPVAGILGVSSPLLAVIALNIVVWRALVARLAPLSTGMRTVVILAVGALLAILSVVLLAGLLLAGVLAILTFEGFS